jgi:hypothetical protein
MTTYYKWLNVDGTTPQGHGAYKLARPQKDGTYTPGAWQRRITGGLVPCRNGYHVMRADQLVYWIGPTLHRVEVDETDMVTSDDKCVVRRVRVVEPVTAWNETTARLFAADCAERALPIFEASYPYDKRPRLAIEAARAFARGEINAETLYAANAAANAADAAAARRHMWERLLPSALDLLDRLLPTEHIEIPDAFQADYDRLMEGATA